MQQCAWCKRRWNSQQSCRAHLKYCEEWKAEKERRAQEAETERETLTSTDGEDTISE